jgi:Domain of unknown function (DUF4055)
MPQATVATKSDAVLAMEPDWALASDLLGGTRTMRQRGRQYLPKWPNETDEAYQLRLQAAVLFPAYKRTVQTLAGKPFSQPISLSEDTPENIRTWLQDIDMQGRNLAAFAGDLMEIALSYGLTGIFVEYPRTEGVLTQAEEAAAGVRPYWIQLLPNQILGWKADRIKGQWKFTQLRFLEIVEEDDGEYGTTKVEQVRVLYPGRWETHRYNDSKTWERVDQGITSLDYVPFVPIYSGRKGFMLATPPMIELAHMNVAHWQSASDQQNILHVARVPILTVSGINDPKWTMTVGASAAVSLPDGASMQYVEHSGAAIGAGSKELEELEERMRQAGAELLVVQTTGRITATQIHVENAVGMCVLQRMTLDLEDAIDQALKITADFIGAPTGGNINIYNDYAASTLAEASAQLLLQTNQAGKLSDETLHTEYQRRGILSTDLSWADEAARIEAQGPALGLVGTGATPPADQVGSGGTQAAAGTPPYGQGTQNAPAAPDLTAHFVELRDSILAGMPAREETPSFDMDALISAIAAIEFPAPVVNIAAQPPAAPPQITVEAPTINVTVPEQQPPIVNIAPAAITVNVPEQAPPVVNVAPAAVNVSSPPVNVTIEKGGSVKFTEDNDGNITGAVMQ